MGAYWTVFPLVFATFLTPTNPPECSAVPLIAPHTFEIAGEVIPGREPDGNSYMLDSTKGLTVIDTGRHESHRKKSSSSRSKEALRLWQ